MLKKPLYFLLLVAVALIFLVIIVETAQQGNLGLADQSLWQLDASSLCLVVLAIAGYVFSRFQKKTELEIAKQARKKDREIAEKEDATHRDIALERQRQNTLEKYFDRMKELLLDKGLADTNADEG